MKNQDTLENQVKSVYLGIGSNLGNRKKNIILAKQFLLNSNVDIVVSSSYYESVSWPNSKFPKYINIVILVKTFLDPEKLLNLCKKIEKKLGRKKRKKNDPRTCDIDIIDYDHKVYISRLNSLLTIPHKEICNRSFVLLPLYEISRSWKHPKSKENINKLISLLDINDLRSIKQI